MEKDSLPLVSVIVPTFNSAKTIEKCLSSLKEQSYKNIEVIVVDDGSNDETLASISNYNVTVVSLKENRGAPHAMNVGAEKANGEYVFFLDADAWAPDWLIEKAVNLFLEDSSYSAVGGWYIPIGGNNLYSLYLRTNTFYRVHEPKKIELYEGNVDPQVYGCFLGFKRDVLSCEKFSENYKAIYDREYMARLAHKGYKVLFVNDLFVYHPTPLTLSKTIQSVHVQSMWMGAVGKHSPIIIKYHLSLLFGVITTLVLSLLISPLILFLVFIAYTLAQLMHFLRLRQRFSITAKKTLQLIGLTYVLTIVTLFSFIIGLFMKPSSHWK